MSDMLTLSRSHIKHKTAEFLNSQCKTQTVNAITVQCQSSQEWSIKIDKTAFEKTCCEDIPYDLGICIMFALEHGYTGITLAENGKVIPYMPRYVYVAVDKNGNPSLEFCYCGPALLYTNVLNEYIQIHAD